jgi:copper chaperone
METLYVVNIKCGGCANKIKASLMKLGLTDIVVSAEEQTVRFQGDRGKAAVALAKLGYPEAGTAAAASLLKKAQSYVSCMVGRVSSEK